MDITRAAIEKNRITAVTLFVIMVAGVMAYIKLPRAEDPGFIIRTERENCNETTYKYYFQEVGLVHKP